MRTYPPLRPPALYQGPTLVRPQRNWKRLGFSPCHGASNRKYFGRQFRQGLKPKSLWASTARLKSGPDTKPEDGVGGRLFLFPVSHTAFPGWAMFGRRPSGLDSITILAGPQTQHCFSPGQLSAVPFDKLRAGSAGLDFVSESAEDRRVPLSTSLPTNRCCALLPIFACDAYGCGSPPRPSPRLGRSLRPSTAHRRG